MAFDSKQVTAGSGVNFKISGWLLNAQYDSSGNLISSDTWPNDVAVQLYLASPQTGTLPNVPIVPNVPALFGPAVGYNATGVTLSGGGTQLAASYLTTPVGNGYAGDLSVNTPGTWLRWWRASSTSTGLDAVLPPFGFPVAPSPIQPGTPPPSVTLPPAYLQLSADRGAYYDSGSTLATNGQGVQQWNDQSTYTHHFQQLTSTSQPIFTTNVQNSLPGLSFDGVDDFLISIASYVPLINFTAIAVIQLSTLDTFMNFLNHNDQLIEGYQWYLQTGVVKGWNQGTVFAGGAITTGTSLLSWSTPPGWNLGFSYNSTTSQPTIPTSALSAVIGAYQSGTEQYLNGYLLALEVYPALSAAQLALRQSQLNTKWQIY